MFVIIGGFPRYFNKYGDYFMNIKVFFGPAVQFFTNLCFGCVFLLVYLQLKGNEDYQYNKYNLATLGMMLFKTFWDVTFISIHEKFRDTTKVYAR